MSESELSEVPSREASPAPSTNHPLSKVGTESSLPPALIQETTNPFTDLRPVVKPVPHL
jgi:hypothetical protein